MLESRATLSDVAALARVSPSTVSRALRSDGRISAPTLARIHEAARRLGYVPNEAARALATGATDTVGLIVPLLADPFWGEFADSFQELANSDERPLLLATTGGKQAREVESVKLLSDKRVRGLVVGAAMDPSTWANAAGSTPVVIVGWDANYDERQFSLAGTLPVADARLLFADVEMPGQWQAHIELDEIEGGRAVARHLVELGHTEIAYAAGPLLRSSLMRLLGIRWELDARGLTIADVDHGPNTFAGGFASARKIQERTPQVTAIIGYNDTLAAGIIAGSRAAGRPVPDHMSVTGFDDVDMAQMLSPAITSVRQPVSEMAKAAVRLLDPEESGLDRPQIKFQGRLAPRGSTAPPASRR